MDDRFGQPGVAHSRNANDSYRCIADLAAKSLNVCSVSIRTSQIRCESVLHRTLFRRMNQRLLSEVKF